MEVVVSAELRFVDIDTLPGNGFNEANERDIFATPLIESGYEHVTAFIDTITEPMQVVATWTCVRSMLNLVPWLRGFWTLGLTPKRRVRKMLRTSVRRS